ncbi:hypothetical protein [Thermocrispum sp.]|jgi:hypothetical protein|uniref:PE domain-containing protein n=1 Tax=Thermocrispum agreste TaxID=37925 RepID=A0ABD6FIH6_9PSEU|nr:hypothetical protein [Thermocrispum sp.]
MAKTLADAEAFARAAAEGQIGIDPDAARTVLNKIRAGKDEVEDLLRAVDELNVQPKLGANPVGTAMARKSANRAAGSEDSYEQALRNLHAHYEKVERALVAAIENYEEMEAAGAESFRRQM